MAVGEANEYEMKRCKIRDGRTISVPNSIEHRIPFGKWKGKEKK